MGIEQKREMNANFEFPISENKNQIVFSDGKEV
jgi:hypothetical protein